MQLRIRSETSDIIVVEWDVKPGQEGFIPMIDGKETLRDGKRHVGTSQTVDNATIGKLQDGSSHAYGINILGETDYGEVASPVVIPPPPPPPPPPTPSGTVQWRGDYSTEFPGWDGVQRKAADRIVSVPASSIPGLADDGQLWARFEVRSGDWLDPNHTVAERAQLDNFKKTAGQEGNEAYWAWSTYYDSAYNPQVTSFPSWNIFQQWQHVHFLGQAMLNFAIDSRPPRKIVLAWTWGDAANPASTQRKFTIDPAFQAGKRYDFVNHVHWSADPTKGFFEVFMNNKIVVHLTYGSTLYNDETAALAIQMLYRQAHTETDVVYQTGLRRADSYAAAIADFPKGTWS